jgi:hypothetical protein
VLTNASDRPHGAFLLKAIKARLNVALPLHFGRGFLYNILDLSDSSTLKLLVKYNPSMRGVFNIYSMDARLDSPLRY